MPTERRSFITSSQLFCNNTDPESKQTVDNMPPNEIPFLVDMDQDRNIAFQCRAWFRHIPTLPDIRKMLFLNPSTILDTIEVSSS